MLNLGVSLSPCMGARSVFLFASLSVTLTHWYMRCEATYRLQTFVGPADVAADALRVCPMAFGLGALTCCYYYHYYYTLFLPKARCVCRQAACKGCQIPTPCWTRQIQARPNQPWPRLAGGGTNTVVFITMIIHYWPFFSSMVTEVSGD